MLAASVLKMFTSPTVEKTLPSNTTLIVEFFGIASPFEFILPKFTLPFLAEPKLVVVLPVSNTTSLKDILVLS